MGRSTGTQYSTMTLKIEVKLGWMSNVTVYNCSSRTVSTLVRIFRVSREESNVVPLSDDNDGELRHRHKDIVGSEKFRLKLLKSYVPQLGERMGARYRNAVQACLDVEGMMNSLGQDPEDAGAAREFFKSRVVQSLAGCFA